MTTPSPAAVRAAELANAETRGSQLFEDASFFIDESDYPTHIAFRKYIDHVSEGVSDGNMPRV